MAFNSFEYIFFLAVVVALYWRLRGLRAQNGFLLAASYLFYAAWDWRFCSLLLILTAVDYLAGLRMAAATGRARRRALLASLAVNLGLLAFFKYFNFFADSLVGLLGTVGLHVSPVTLNVLLPLGISFYTFQSISYLLDVYQGSMQPTRSLLNFATYLAFFPPLTAGPIERAAHLLPQMECPRRPDAAQFESGVVLILLGLFKKIVIADVAASLIDPNTFSAPAQVAGGVVLSSVYLFAIQLYVDFSAYSDIARGSAALLGFDLLVNFNQPYFSQTATEFWTRWHISLSGWFRTYVFLPLSRTLLKRWGTQRREAAQAAATLVTMLLSGLWHGASWTFVLWGGLLGVYQIVGQGLRGRAAPLLRHPSVGVRWLTIAVRIFVTFHLVLFAWVLFRADSLSVVPGIYAGMLSAYLGQGRTYSQFVPVLVLYAVVFTLDIAQAKAGDHAFPRAFPAGGRALLYAGALVCMIIFAVKPYVPFLYFQF
jgi:D-alanyl-lipoteichoic acid acyltransferase DltB (MBOAT superfamily)